MICISISTTSAWGTEEGRLVRGRRAEGVVPEHLLEPLLELLLELLLLAIVQAGDGRQRQVRLGGGAGTGRDEAGTDTGAAVGKAIPSLLAP